jgi:hypothetical protein
MNIKDIRAIFTDAELALIDAGKYMPGRAVLDAKLDLAAAMEREACAKVADDLRKKEKVYWSVYGADSSYYLASDCATAIRARENMTE